MAFWVLRAPDEAVREIADALLAARERVRPCATCGAFTEADPCPICADAGRDRSAICVVEAPADVIAFERAGTYRGLYHVLGGAIAPLDGVHPEDLRIEALLRRVEAGAVAEVILATDPNTEGEATALYVAERLREEAPRVRVSRLAHGLPVGGDLEYADALTLGKALEGRRPVG
jgi:recombination protein RecR